MSVHELFDRAAERYDAARRQLLPCFDDLYGVALRLLPADRALPLRVLDIGAGTGLFAALIAEQYPRAELTLIDLAPDMLAKAGERMARYGPRVAIRQLDMLEIGQLGKFDAIVSALAIHHATDAQKQAIFRAIASMLPPGGRFVHVEQVLGPTPAIESAYEQAWLDAVRAKGVSPADLAAAQERMRHDRAAPLAAQLGWLAEAGFASVHCWYQWYRFVVYSGERPDPGAAPA